MPTDYERIFPAGNSRLVARHAIKVLQKVHTALGGCYLFFHVPILGDRLIHMCHSFHFVDVAGDTEFLDEVVNFFSTSLLGESSKNKRFPPFFVVPGPLEAQSPWALPYHKNPRQAKNSNSKKLDVALKKMEESETPYILLWVPALEGRVQKAYPQDLGDGLFSSAPWVKWSMDPNVIMQSSSFELHWKAAMDEIPRPATRQRIPLPTQARTIATFGNGDVPSGSNAPDAYISRDSESMHPLSTPEWLDLECRRCNTPVKLTPVCRDGNRLVIVLPEVDETKRGVKLGKPVLVSECVFVAVN